MDKSSQPTAPLSSEKPEPDDIVHKYSKDASLLTRIKNGDTDAFQTFFYRWSDPLYHFIYNITGSQQEAEDISQETFAVIWQKRDTIDPDKNIKTFIFLIAKQIAWKKLRKMRMQDEFSSGEFAVTDNVSSDDLVVAKELQLLTDYVIGRLPQKTREIYLMHYEKSLSNEQIAEKLKISAHNVASHIYIARKKIKDILMVFLAFFIV